MRRSTQKLKLLMGGQHEIFVDPNHYPNGKPASIPFQGISYIYSGTNVQGLWRYSNNNLRPKGGRGLVGVAL